MRAAQKDLNQLLRAGWKQNKDQAEKNLLTCDTKKLWDTIREMTTNSMQKPTSVDNETAKENELNDFYQWFEMNNSRECCDVEIE